MSENKHTLHELQQLQALPLDLKIAMTKNRIRAWINEYGEDGVYLSFSGGKDSSVLLHLVRQEYPNVKAVFFNTSLEYPEIVRFVKTFQNVDFIRPKMTFKQVCQKYGYPIISKEVSECVYGARKYLKKVLTDLGDDETVFTNERTNERTPYSYRFEKLCGYGKYEKYFGVGYDNKYRKLRGIGNYSKCGRTAGTDTTSTPTRYWDTETERLISSSTRNLPEPGNTRICHQDQRRKEMWGGATHHGDLERLPESLRLKTALTQDYGKTIDNYRIQRLMNILPNEPRKATAETIPSESDRSMFSCERYQFFLDAPFEICNNCCNIMKKNPSKDYQKKTGRVPITAQMASESRLRTQVWLKNGCNAFDAKKPISNPLSFWVEDDILYYIYLHGEEMVETRKKAFEAAHPELTKSELAKIYENGEWGAICSVYGEIVKENEVDGQLDLEDLGVFDMGRQLLKTTGAQRTGCFPCLFGIHLEKEPNRLQRMKVTHPKLYKWMMKPESEGGLGYKDKIDWINAHGNMRIKYE